MSSALFDSRVRRFPPHILPPEEPTLEVVPTPKPARPTPGFWASVGWVVVIHLTMCVPLLIGLAVACFSHPEILRGQIPSELFGRSTHEVGLWIMLAGHAFCAALALVVLRVRLGRAWMKELGLNRLPIGSLLLAALCVPGLQLLVGLTGLVMQILLSRPDSVASVITSSASSVPFWLMLLAIAVAPAVNEELWFRGFLGRGMVGRYGAFVGVLLTSLLFGVYHLSPIQSVYTIIMGVAVHLMYLATRSLWVPMVVHFLFNGWAVGLAALASLASSATPSAAPAPAENVSTMLVVLVLGGYAVVVWGMMAAAGWGMYRLRVREVA